FDPPRAGTTARSSTSRSRIGAKRRRERAVQPKHDPGQGAAAPGPQEQTGPAGPPGPGSAQRVPQVGHRAAQEGFDERDVVRTESFLPPADRAGVDALEGV